MMEATRPRCLDRYTHTEARTANADLVKIQCHPDDVQKVKELLAQIRRVEIPETHFVSNASHGSYGMYSRYSIKQHRYSGGNDEMGWSFREVLEIVNPPDGRHGIVLYEHSSEGSAFIEFDSIEEANQAFSQRVFLFENQAEFEKMPGFIRFVLCSALTPWFYAIGTEELIGDYSFPEVLQNDPVYRFGRKFVTTEYDKNGNYDLEVIKTCLGSRFIQKKLTDSNGYRTHYATRLVYWDDGTLWQDDGLIGTPPRPLEENELWITKAMAQFRQFLSGKNTNFKIDFTNGQKFVGKLTSPKELQPSPEGDYFAKVTFPDGKTREGWVFDFEPTKIKPNIIAYINNCYKTKPTRIEITKQKTTPKSKKWQGVYYAPSQ